MEIIFIVLYVLAAGFVLGVLLENLPSDYDHFMLALVLAAVWPITLIVGLGIGVSKRAKGKR